MKRILILCEGQTEETFVNRILAPHLQSFEKVAIPKILVTKKAKSGYEFHGGNHFLRSHSPRRAKFITGYKCHLHHNHAGLLRST